MTDGRKFYKATRLDGTSFYDSTTKWQVGRITRHANPDLTAGVCSDGVLHVSDVPGETLIGGSWPCRLFEVEPSGPITAPEGHKYGCAAVKVVRELPAWQVFGPNGEAVVAVITRAATLSAAERDALVAAWDAARAATWDAARAATWDATWDAARAATWDAARDAARDAAWVAAGDAARDAAGDAAGAELTRDLITDEQYTLLIGPWRSVTG